MIRYFHSTFVIIKSSREKKKEYLLLLSGILDLPPVANVFRHRVHLGPYGQQLCVDDDESKVERVLR